MNVIVVGCGKIGTNIIASLAEEGHNVVAIDDSSAVVSDINNIYDVMGVCGNGANCEVLEEAGVRPENIQITDICTCCNPGLLFSHRISGRKRGNNAGFIMLR